MVTDRTLVLCEKDSLNIMNKVIKKTDKVLIVCLDHDIHKMLLSKNIEHKNIWDYSLSESSDIDILTWFKQWADKPIFGNSTIKEIFDYKGISLWWFLEIGIFDSYKGLNNPVSVKKLLEKLELLDLILKIEKPQHVIHLNTFNPHNFYYSEICSILGCDSKHIKNKKILLSSFFWSGLFPTFLRFFVIFRFFARKIASSLLYSRYKKRQMSPFNKNYVIISLTSNWRNKKDFIFESLIHRINKKNKVTRIDFPVFSLIGLKNILEMKQLKYHNIFFRIAEGYDINFGELLAATKNLQRSYEKLKNTDVYYKSYNITKLFYKQMDFHIYSYGLQNSIYFIETVLEIIYKESPECLILIDEYNPIGRAVIIGGKLSGVRTIALQHGAISKNRPSYVHFQSEVSKKGEYHTPYYPLADITAVFGPYYLNLLEEIGNYPPDSLSVTGSIKYDLVPEKLKYLNKNKTLSEIGLDLNKRTILYTSQPIDPEENKKIFMGLVKAISELPDSQLIIKLHPAETSISKELISNIDGKIKVLQKIDIYEIINSCDIMMTAFSTTALEAMILHKPVITINFTGKEDMMPYAASGAAIGVYSEEELVPAILSIFENESVRSSLDKNAEIFVYEHLYKMDGEATTRVLNIIENSG
ncbi:UDP-N-acetylglucosamine 2-epimerase [Methanolobus bombayensis]|uniref:UDP-N-acetylglucosamine 2-epimerase n=1 Tax=Methanolobus bombayensis TaxID=38023 RepID=UPI001AE8FE33|nr:UDP-N-acetylglucosamine 2-epimerase [Methanolobus bombayensis]MBP1908188.1 spore coat polysaccharide biosynthesis predicted glycosyltransferase SpsG [Methanolobus bombayensis]